MTDARDPVFATALRGLTTGRVAEGEALARWSTYRIGGPATVLFPGGPEDVARALKHCRDAGVPWFALGLGSNLLFPDEGLGALVIRMGKGVDGVVHDGDRWTFGAGLPAPHAAKRTASAGWGGVHKMVGVPGSVGGGIVMNAGCHGAEWRDTVESVLVVGQDGHDRVIAAADAGFSYRRSALGDVVVLATTVRLHAEAPETLEAETESLYKWRRDGTPVQPAVLRQRVQESGPAGWMGTRPAPHQWAVHRGDRAQGVAGGRGRSLTDARELFHQHRWRHGR